MHSIILDHRPSFLDEAVGEHSLLRTPLGKGTLLRHMCDGMALQPCASITILTTFEFDERYTAAMRREMPSLERITSPAGLTALLDELEPSDRLLLVDPAAYPVGGLTAREVSRLADENDRVAHLVTLDRGGTDARERVLFDHNGSVRRIQRLYSGVTWINTNAVICTVISTAVARIAADRRFSSLADFRSILAARGVPARDVFFEGDAIDLTTEEGLLSVVERSVMDMDQGRPHAGRAHTRPIYVGAECRIHPTARFAGPVVLQDNVIIDENTTIVGPTLLGTGSRVGADSIVAHCVAGPGSVFPTGSIARRRFVCSNGVPRTEAIRDDRPASFGAATTPAGGSVLDEDDTGRARFVYPAIKCLLDCLTAAVTLALFAPLFAVVALLIKLESRGALFFSHAREGKDGRAFRCWKFRTMVDGAHNLQRALYKQNLVDGPQFKLKSDPRVTPLGRFLRSTNVDELPQLFNVALGQMSLIGPRPSPFRENQICVPWRQARLSVRPGITGLWQICRNNRSSGDFHQWIYYDMLYVRHLSPWLDVKILLATVLTLGGRWSVPLHWIIPGRKLRARESVETSSRFPILEIATPTPNRPVADETEGRTLCPSA